MMISGEARNGAITPHMVSMIPHFVYILNSGTINGVKGVDEMSQEEYRKAAIEAVKKLSVDVGIPTKLEAIKEEDLQFLAESAHADACAPGNPKDASVEDLKDLFRKIM